MIKNGETEKTFSYEDKPTHIKEEFSLKADDTGWFALRLYGKKSFGRKATELYTEPGIRLPYSFAHTSPIYIQFGKNPMQPKKEDVEYFLNWISLYRGMLARIQNGELSRNTGAGYVTEAGINLEFKYIDQAVKAYQDLLRPENYRRWE